MHLHHSGGFEYDYAGVILEGLTSAERAHRSRRRALWEGLPGTTDEDERAQVVVTAWSGLIANYSPAR
jgi:hypothetical protein